MSSKNVPFLIKILKNSSILVDRQPQTVSGFETLGFSSCFVIRHLYLVSV